uniref:Uncharacterized protein n=1 Tax=Pediastrum duplex TaxID=3105 RepID=A0A2U8GI63_PEDDU|nr:hypothetical protein [Pediastrum duplex]
MLPLFLFSKKWRIKKEAALDSLASVPNLAFLPLCSFATTNSLTLLLSLLLFCSFACVSFASLLWFLRQSREVKSIRIRSSLAQALTSVRCFGFFRFGSLPKAKE